MSTVSRRDVVSLATRCRRDASRSSAAEWAAFAGKVVGVDAGCGAVDDEVGPVPIRIATDYAALLRALVETGARQPPRSETPEPCRQRRGAGPRLSRSSSRNTVTPSSLCPGANRGLPARDLRPWEDTLGCGKTELPEEVRHDDDG
jgi:hypothetical protein